MRDSGFTGDVAIPVERQAVGYDGATRVRLAAEHPYGAYDFRYQGMGGLVTSAEDLWRFAQAFVEGRVLKPETARLMHDAPRDHQGLGWGVLESARGTLRLVHGGAVRGFHTAFEVLPEERGAIVVLLNAEGVPPWTIQWNLHAMLFDEPPRYPVPPTPIDLPAAALDALAGTYADASGARLVARRSGGGLRLLAEGVAAAGALDPGSASPELAQAGARARRILTAILEKDVEAIRAALPEGAFYAATWPEALVGTIWPREVEAWGALGGSDVASLRSLRGGASEGVLALRHERGERRMRAVFLRDGRLSTLSFEAPDPSEGRLYLPTAPDRFEAFDWEGLPVHVVRFETEAEGRRTLVLTSLSGHVRRFVQDP
jgi:hypothetical protein